MVNATGLSPTPPLLMAFQAVAEQALAQATPTPAPAPDQLQLQPPAASRYTVRSGDSLVSIAQRELGSKVRWQEIWQLNREQIANPNLIVAGMALRMPGGAAPAPTSAPPLAPATPLAPGANPPRAELEAMLDAAADRHGIPRAILKGIAERESNWRQFNEDGSPVAHGNPGSTDWGLMQINDAAHPQAFPRAKTDLAYNLEYGATYLAQQYRRYGNWSDAVAAYNAGSVRHAASGGYANQAYVSFVLDAARHYGQTGEGMAYYA